MNLFSVLWLLFPLQNHFRYLYTGKGQGFFHLSFLVLFKVTYYTPDMLLTQLSVKKSNQAKFCTCRVLFVVVLLRREGQGGAVPDVLLSTEKSLYIIYTYTCQRCAIGI